MADSIDKGIVSFLQIFHLQMEMSTQAYRQYLQHEQQFLYAKELRRINSISIQLLEDNEQRLPINMRKAAQALLSHFHQWRNKWDETAQAQHPHDNSKFAYANEHTFPKQAAAILEEAYQQTINNKT